MNSQPEKLTNHSDQPGAQPLPAAEAGQKGGELREAMPQVAAFIDECRAAFGARAVNAQIRAGLAGEPAFYAEENGKELGTKIEGGVLVEYVWDGDTLIGTRAGGDRCA